MDGFADFLDAAIFLSGQSGWALLGIMALMAQ
jgi:hypothetical protein